MDDNEGSHKADRKEMEWFYLRIVSVKASDQKEPTIKSPESGRPCGLIRASVLNIIFGNAAHPLRRLSWLRTLPDPQKSFENPKEFPARDHALGKLPTAQPAHRNGAALLFACCRSAGKGGSSGKASGAEEKHGLHAQGSGGVAGWIVSQAARNLRRRACRAGRRNPRAVPRPRRRSRRPYRPSPSSRRSRAWA